MEQPGISRRISALPDPDRCFNAATYGITTGEHTQSTCDDHIAAVMTAMTVAGKGVSFLVYPLQANRRCHCSYREISRACSAHMVIDCDADECQAGSS